MWWSLEAELFQKMTAARYLQQVYVPYLGQELPRLKFLSLLNQLHKEIVESALKMIGIGVID